MFDWNTELELTRRQIADLEVKVSELREELQDADVPSSTAVPIDRILDSKRRILSIRMASLDRARFHARFVEHKIATGAKGIKALPYADLALVCFKAVDWMPRGEASEAVRRTGAAFYNRAMLLNKAMGGTPLPESRSPAPSNSGFKVGPR
jgi:hypothetical protein